MMMAGPAAAKSVLSLATLILARAKRLTSRAALAKDALACYADRLRTALQERGGLPKAEGLVAVIVWPRESWRNGPRFGVSRLAAIHDMRGKRSPHSQDMRV